MSLIRPNIKLPRAFSLVDVVVLAALGATVYGLVSIGSGAVAMRYEPRR